MDIDGSGKIDWNEFFASIITSRIIMKEENLLDAFKFFDRENRGYITSKDFKTTLGDPFLTLGGVDSDFANVISEVFPGKEKITFEDLKNFMVQSNDNIWFPLS